MVSLKMLLEIMFVIHRAGATVWISWEEQAVSVDDDDDDDMFVVCSFNSSLLVHKRYFYSAEWICCE